MRSKSPVESQSFLTMQAVYRPVNRIHCYMIMLWSIIIFGPKAVTHGARCLTKFTARRLLPHVTEDIATQTVHGGSLSGLTTSTAQIYCIRHVASLDFTFFHLCKGSPWCALYKHFKLVIGKSLIFPQNSPQKNEKSNCFLLARESSKLTKYHSLCHWTFIGDPCSSEFYAGLIFGSSLKMFNNPVAGLPNSRNEKK